MIRLLDCGYGMMLRTMNERVEYLCQHCDWVALLNSRLLMLSIQISSKLFTLPVSVVLTEEATTTTPMLLSEVVTELSQWTFMFQVIITLDVYLLIRVFGDGPFLMAQLIAHLFVCSRLSTHSWGAAVRCFTAAEENQAWEEIKNLVSQVICFSVSIGYVNVVFLVHLEPCSSSM